MLDILTKARAKGLSAEKLGLIEAAIEYALGGVAEIYYSRSKTKNWREAYNYAASFLSPEEGSALTIKRMKKEYPPILGISTDSNLHELSRDYFLSLLKVKDPQAVIQGLINLKRWRGEESEVGSWASAMITSLVNNYNNSIEFGGTCVCTKCHKETPKMRGVACTMVPCPSCGGIMIRKAVEAKLYAPGDPNEPLSSGMERLKQSDIEDVTEGDCVCPKCGYSVPYTGSPGEKIECPYCPGTMMQFKALKVSKGSKKLKKK